MKISGNTNLNEKIFTWTLDATPPEITNLTVSLESAGTQYKFHSVETEEVEQRQCMLDDGLWFDCTIAELYPVNLGNHELKVRVFDHAGNVSSPKAFSWSSPSTGIDTAINSSIPNNSQTSSTSITFTMTGPSGASFECRLDGGSFSSCSSTKTYNNLGDGDHSFEARAKIGSNIDPTPARWDWNIYTGCLIATATFGSDMAHQVQQLREIRENILFRTNSGTAFMLTFNSIYYTFSPTIANWENQNQHFKEIVKITITPLLSSLSILTLADIDSEPKMITYGIGIILLNIGMYFVAPAFVVLRLKKFLKEKRMKTVF
jgi:hypothetical protein